jgi:hypothetical protein
MAAVAATNTTGNIIPGSLPAQLFLPVIFQKKKKKSVQVCPVLHMFCYISSLFQ